MTFRIAVAALLAVSPSPAQDPALEPVAEAARRALQSHDFRALLGDAAAVRLRLPGQRGGAPLRGSIAVAVLEAFTRPVREVAVSVVGAAVVGDRQGYVELERRFKRTGVDQTETHRVLLSVRHSGERWRVVEVWMVPEPLK
jgi:hypothetical protein